jgi:hypothetical protein
VYVQMFHRNGLPLTGVMLAHAPSRYDRYFGTVTSGPNGEVAVAWAADVGRQSSPNYYNNAMGRIFSSRLAPLTGELMVGKGSSYDNSGPFPDAIALAADGSLAAALTYAGDGVYVYATRVSRNGTPLAIDLPYDVNVSNTYDASLAMAPDGRFLVVWDTQGPVLPSQLPLASQPPGPILGRLFHADGTADGADAFQVDRRVPGQRTDPKVVWTAGGYVAIWEDESGQDGNGSGLFGRLLTLDGAPVGGDFQVDVTSAGNQGSPALAAGPRSAVAVWVTEDSTNVYARRIAFP